MKTDTTYSYRLTASAVQDLSDLKEYVSQILYAHDHAEQLLNDIQNEIEKACRFPFSLPAIDDPLLCYRGYRRIPVKNFIVYVIPDSDAHILNVMRILFHGRDRKYLLE